MGRAARTTHPTPLNPNSHPGHAVLTLYVKKTTLVPGQGSKVTTEVRITLVDLGGTGRRACLRPRWHLAVHARSNGR